jgi:hypothetical protein
MLICTNLLSQVSPNKYCIELTDKNNNTYSLEHPEQFLTQRALERRAKQNIGIDYTDLPVSNHYIDSLRNLGLKILNVSKWYNFVTVYTTNTNLIDTITNISFVANVLTPPNKKTIENIKVRKHKYNTKKHKEESKNIAAGSYYNYGDSYRQININKADKLHNEGFRGAGILIAITDAGFSWLPNLPSFDSIYNENRVLATRNFVHGGTHVYDYNTHGTRVFSILGANYSGQLIGSAPEAEFLLLMSEDPHSETYIEELNWVSAAEFADSLGADIINVSLGYVEFDTPEFNHSYFDMNGKTALISRAATMAAHKGIIVVSAAANNGRSSTYPWIGAPADADSILSVGAINQDKLYASFSSTGPAADGRIKPDIVAMGEGAYNQNENGSVGRGSGTSFAAPLISGFVACLWQKYPQKNNMEIIDAVKKAANFYNNPTDTLGYGIPDFELASAILDNNNFSIDDLNNNILMYPNPFINNCNIVVKDNVDSVIISVSDINGKLIFSIKEKVTENRLYINDLNYLPSGVYLISFIINEKKYSKKIVKEQ